MATSVCCGEALVRFVTDCDHMATSVNNTQLVKQNAARALREAVLQGRVAPGERIVEATWAEELGAAQASVREAINILVGEGLVTKAPRRSARVISLTEEEVLHIYDARLVLEGLAARLVAEGRGDVEALRAPCLEMRSAVERGDYEELLRADLQFHLALCKESGNQFLYEAVVKMITPLFAFATLRVQRVRQPARAWLESVADHERIIDVIKLGDPSTAECYIRHVMGRFSEAGRRVWVHRTVR